MDAHSLASNDARDDEFLDGLVYYLSDDFSDAMSEPEKIPVETPKKKHTISMDFRERCYVYLYDVIHENDLLRNFITVKRHGHCFYLTSANGVYRYANGRISDQGFHLRFLRPEDLSAVPGWVKKAKPEDGVYQEVKDVFIAEVEFQLRIIAILGKDKLRKH